MNSNEKICFSGNLFANSRKLLNTLLFFSILSAILLRVYINEKVQLFLALILFISILIVLINFRFIGKCIRFYKYFFSLVLVCFAVGLLNGVVSYFDSIFYLLIFIISVVSSLALLTVDIRFILLLSRYFLYSTFVIISVSSGLSSEAFSDGEVSGVRNSFSALLVFSQIFYSASYFSNFKRLPLVTVFITVFLSFYLYGRSGMISSILVLLLTIIHHFRNFKFVLVFILPFFVLGGYELFDNYVHIFESTNFVRGVESARSEINRDYINELSFVSFVVGLDLSAIPLIVFFDGNPHNSFILGHYLMGVFYIIIFPFILFRVLYFGMYIHACLLFVFMIRCFTDVVSLPGIFDIVFFYIYFSCLPEFATVNKVGNPPALPRRQ